MGEPASAPDRDPPPGSPPRSSASGDRRRASAGSVAVAIAAREPAIAGELDRGAIPRHVAIVMDGNGRWASDRGSKRTDGHAAGEEALFDTVEGALDDRAARG